MSTLTSNPSTLFNMFVQRLLNNPTQALSLFNIYLERLQKPEDIKSLQNIYKAAQSEAKQKSKISDIRVFQNLAKKALQTDQKQKKAETVLRKALQKRKTKLDFEKALSQKPSERKKALMELFKK